MLGFEVLELQGPDDRLRDATNHIIALPARERERSLAKRYGCLLSARREKWADDRGADCYAAR